LGNFAVELNTKFVGRIMVNLVMERKDKTEDEEKLLPEEFKRWQEREPNRRVDNNKKEDNKQKEDNKPKHDSKHSPRSKLRRQSQSLTSQKEEISHCCAQSTSSSPVSCCSSFGREEEMLEQMQDSIKKKLEIAKTKTVETEQQHNEVLKKIELENTAELNKIKTLLGEQREVGSQWEKELAILKFKFSCKLDSIKHNNSRIEAEIDKLEKAVYKAQADCEMSRELCGELSGQYTRLARKLKKEMDKDEESYMEMFI